MNSVLTQDGFNTFHTGGMHILNQVVRQYDLLKIQMSRPQNPTIIFSTIHISTYSTEATILNFWEKNGSHTDTFYLVCRHARTHARAQSGAPTHLFEAMMLF